MSTKRKIFTALSVITFITIGILAYLNHHKLTSTFIVLPNESVRMLLAPTHSTVKQISNK